MENPPNFSGSVVTIYFDECHGLTMANCLIMSRAISMESEHPNARNWQLIPGLVNIEKAMPWPSRNSEFSHINSMVNLSSSFFVDVYQRVINPTCRLNDD